MARDVLERLRGVDPAVDMPEADLDDRERLRRAIVATPFEPRTVSVPQRRRLARPTLVALLGVAVLLACGAAYAAHQVIGDQSKTPSLAPVSAAGRDRIVFSLVRGWSVPELYVVGPRGMGLRRLMTGWAAAFSPDGSKIAYVGNGLQIMNADGSDKRRLVDASTRTTVSWSPDGKRIVFVSEGLIDDSDEGELFVVNADGSGVRRLSPERVFGKDPVWAPDGRIYFDTSNLHQTADVSSPDFGRDVHGAGEICSIDPDGSDLEVVTAVPTPTSFSLSPDGTWLLIWDSSADRLVRLLASGQGTEVVVVDNLSRLCGHSSSPPMSAVESSWSPDGTRIAFTCPFTTSGGGGAGRLYVVRIDGSGLKRVPLPNGAIPRDPVWQPR
jgi:Tol biopolymer transport system component